MVTEAQWYYSNDGEQVGPFTVAQLRELADVGTLTLESNLWTQGLEDWVRGSQVDGLWNEPVVTPETSAPAAQPISQQSSGEQEYPPTPPLKASFGKLLIFVLGGPVLMIVAFILGMLALGTSSSAVDPGGSADAQATIGVLLVLGGYVIGSISSIIGKVFAMVYLSRAWDLLKWGAPQASPGKAVGFLFIPLFNLYWMFIAYYGLAKDWNRIMASHSDLAHAPRMNEGMFLAYCICFVSGIGLPIAMVLWFVMYADICKGINFMASRATFKAKPGGLQFY